MLLQVPRVKEVVSIRPVLTSADDMPVEEGEMGQVRRLASA